MRVFIAIELPKEVRDYLYVVQKKIGGKEAKIKWVSKKNIHLTLKFLGEITEERLDKLKEILKNIKFKSFKIKLSKIGVFPNENQIRVVWVGLKPEEKILELQRKIDESLLELFPTDQKFISHLTLGRVKLIKQKNEFIEKLNNFNVEEMSFEINEFKLIKSKLTKDGPSYEIIEKY
ncbi:RNA 2',3'-cyclic phosphodiesterase [archaeon]|nr:RNA 2',3'-cyclic phosphodiesterase [archaeon]|tara:strand:+ start:118 stop:648 length:531 start_codon:yes stop_codon:yes gene_type:complete